MKARVKIPMKAFRAVRREADGVLGGRVGQVVDRFENFKHAGRDAYRLAFHDEADLYWFWHDELER